MRYIESHFLISCILISLAAFIGITADAKQQRPNERSADTSKVISVTIPRAGSFSTVQQTITANSGERIEWQVFSNGGGQSISLSFQIFSVIHQTASGESVSNNYILQQGFLQEFISLPCCVGLRGNVNGDVVDVVDVLDIIVLINLLFITFEPLGCLEEADVNGDEEVNILDIVTLVNSLFITFEPMLPCP